MKNSEFTASIDYFTSVEKSGRVSWQSPSNLAIIKYWGKHGIQLPQNPSLSITLSEAITTTLVTYTFDKKIKALSLDFLFKGAKNDAFRERTMNFLNSLQVYFPFLANIHLSINSKNSFPHSSGIASSASSMSALALCLCDIEQELLISDELITNSEFLRNASFISRLGSGSAARSVYPSFALWGKTNCMEGSSDIYAIPIKEYHDIYNGLRNDILIVSKSEKSVSSSKGHELMKTNAYAQSRFSQAYERIGDLSEYLRSGDIWDFGNLLESEALTLHALMMASSPSYVLLEPETIRVINAIRTFRIETNIPVFFSLDAGPNVHVISIENDRSQVKNLLDELKNYTQDGEILYDKLGNGPKRIL